jgi:nucleoside-diphosphate-sugar epimerase
VVIAQVDLEQAVGVRRVNGLVSSLHRPLTYPVVASGIPRDHDGDDVCDGVPTGTESGQQAEVTVRVVVTGATGNIGTSLVDVLGSDDRVTEIVGVARRMPDWSPPKTTFLAEDIRAPNVESWRGADVVVHLAWAFQPTHRPLETWDVNVIGGIRAFEAAATAGASALVYASSVGAYSPADGRRVDESWPTHSVPTAAYGREKAYLERYLDAFEQRHPHIRVVRLRPAFVFQRAAASEQRRIFTSPLLPPWLVRRGRLPAVPAPAGLRFQAVHARDAAEAFRLAVVGDARGAFNVAAEPVIDLDTLASLLGARPIAVPAAAARAAVALAWRLHLVRSDDALLDLFLRLPLLDAGRAHRELGWTPAHTGLEAVSEMLDGMADGAGGPTAPLAPTGAGDAASRAVG